jgi:hypothetical protein
MTTGTMKKTRIYPRGWGICEQEIDEEEVVIRKGL